MGKYYLILFAVILPLCGCVETGNVLDDIGLRKSNSVIDVQAYNSIKPELSGGLTIDRAIELALKYNIDLWLARQEELIQKEIKTSSFLKMLPRLTFDYNAEMRDSYDASSSVGLFTGEEAQLTKYSYSSEKQQYYGGLKLLWNALDFGVSYFKAKQEQNRQKQGLHSIRRVRQKIALDVAAAYWQCVSLMKVVEKAEVIEQEFDAELASIKESVSKGALSDSAGLERSYNIKSQKVKIREMSEKYNSAKVNLLRLMGLPLDSEFSLVAPSPVLSRENFDIDELEDLALNNRPEFFQQDLEVKITRDEARATLLRILPSPQLFVNPQANGNKYLYYNSWFSAGLNVSWNLLESPSRIFEAKSNFKRIDFLRIKRMALAAAVITQVRLAVIEYDCAVDKFKMLGDLKTDSDKLVENLAKSVDSGRERKSKVTAQKVRNIEDLSKYMEAYVSLMVAKAKIYNSAGLDPVSGSGGVQFNTFSQSSSIPTNSSATLIEEKTVPLEVEPVVVNENEGTSSQYVYTLDASGKVVAHKIDGLNYVQDSSEVLGQ